MKKIITRSMILTSTLLVAQITQAQETTYLSSLSPTSTGAVSVGSNSWLAAEFVTGNNVGGYILNSVQLGMTDAVGSPNGFTAMIFNNKPILGGTGVPGSNIDTLSGSLNPVTAGTYTYNPTADFILSSSTGYYIVLTAGTAVANGAYEWSESAYPPNASIYWGAGNGVFESNNGASGWSPTPYLGIAQFAINATAVPEPSSEILLGFGSLIFLWHRRKVKAV
jgi:hypothetical protein